MKMKTAMKMVKIATLSVLISIGMGASAEAGRLYCVIESFDYATRVGPDGKGVEVGYCLNGSNRIFRVLRYKTENQRRYDSSEDFCSYERAVTRYNAMIARRECDSSSGN